MQKIVNRQVAVSIILLGFLFALSSCSEDSYVDVIPENSTALIAVDAMRLTDSGGYKGQIENKLQSILGMDDMENCGIDFSRKIYLFETVEGNIGLVAKVTDEDALDDTFDAMSKKGICKKTEERKGINFTVIKDVWVAGFSSDALLLLGPVLPVQQSVVRQQINRLLKQDSDKSVKGTHLFDKLDSIDSPIAMVAQAAALPEKLAQPLILGAPKDVDESQILIAASLEATSGDCLEVKGEAFSFNNTIDKALKESSNIFRPISGKYLDSMPKDAVLGVFMNVEGNSFIPLLHANKSFQTLLAGMNTAIDIDKIVKSIDGEFSFVVSDISEDKLSAQMSAQLGSKDFLDDVPYWKMSCPRGCSITDWKENAYHFTDGTIHYYFGVTDDMEFFSGSDLDVALRSVTQVPTPLSYSIRQKIKGKRLCVALNIEAISNDNGAYEIMKEILRLLFGNVNTVLYIAK